MWILIISSAPDAVQARGVPKKRSGTSALPTVYKRSLKICHSTYHQDPRPDDIACTLLEEKKKEKNWFVLLAKKKKKKKKKKKSLPTDPVFFLQGT